jgi:UDPglucose 6-dehydrogenase
MASEHMRKKFPSVYYASSAKDALRDADCCIIMTEWPEFSRLDDEFSVMKQPPVSLEGRRMLNRKDVEGICW